MARRNDPPPSRRERRAQARFDRSPEPRRRQSRHVARPAWQSPVALVTGAAILIGLAVIAFARPSVPDDQVGLVGPPTSYAADLVDGELLGSPTAPVLIELYSDFQCPACKLFVTAQLQRLTTEFVVPGTVRIQAKDIAFLGRGQPDESLELTAGAACAAEQDRYWTFHDFIFWNQGRENLGDHDAAFIARVADAAGVDRTAWDACMAGPEVRTAIRAATNAALGAGIDSTPTLVVNSQRVVGVPNYDELAALIRSMAPGPSPS
jgi:protein-disulfide isomerase